MKDHSDFIEDDMSMNDFLNRCVSCQYLLSGGFCRALFKNTVTKTGQRRKSGRLRSIFDVFHCEFKRS